MAQKWLKMVVCHNVHRSHRQNAGFVTEVFVNLHRKILAHLGLHPILLQINTFHCKSAVKKVKYKTFSHRRRKHLKSGQASHAPKVSIHGGWEWGRSIPLPRGLRELRKLPQQGPG